MQTGWFEMVTFKKTLKNQKDEKAFPDAFDWIADWLVFDTEARNWFGNEHESIVSIALCSWSKARDRIDNWSTNFSQPKFEFDFRFINHAWEKESFVLLRLREFRCCCWRFWWICLSSLTNLTIVLIDNAPTLTQDFFLAHYTRMGSTWTAPNLFRLIHQN